MNTSQSEPGIKGVLVDFGNVVGHYRTEHFCMSIAKHINPRIEDPYIIAGFFYSDTWKLFETGDLDIFRVFEDFQDEFNIGPNYKVDQFTRLVSKIFYIDEAMLAVLQALKRQDIKLILVTNNNELHMDELIANHPNVLRLFDRQAVSSRLGYRKPDERMFTYPITSLGLVPQECLLIDDGNSNVEAFRELGGHVFHYDVTCPKTHGIQLDRIPSVRLDLLSQLRRLGIQVSAQ